MMHVFSVPCALMMIFKSGAFTFDFHSAQIFKLFQDTVNSDYNIWTAAIWIIISGHRQFGL